MPSQSNGLRFDIYERVHLPDDVAAIDELDEIELVPRIGIVQQEDQVLLKGHLLLTGVYRAPDEPLEEQSLEHWIPVEITLPLNRIHRLDDISVEIDNFDVDVLSARTINITGVLSLFGIEIEQPNPPQEDWQREEPFTVVHRREEEAVQPYYQTYRQQPQFAGENQHRQAAELEQQALSAAQLQAEEEHQMQARAAQLREQALLEAAQQEAVRQEAARQEEARLQAVRQDAILLEAIQQEAQQLELVREAEELESAQKQPAIEQSGIVANEPEPSQTEPIIRQPATVQSAIVANEPEPSQTEPIIRQPAIEQSAIVANEPEPSQMEPAIRQPAAPPAASFTEPAQSFSEATASDAEAASKPMRVAVAGKPAEEDAAKQGAGNVGFRSLLQSSQREQEARAAAEQVAERAAAEARKSSGDEIEWKNLFYGRPSEDRSFRKLRMCIVQREETLDVIAGRYQLQAREIALYNRLSDQSVSEGQVLYIP
ncbi:LysM peptidoglycan-binding domain-containing protein [Paenibacillus sp. R14(2021)]|uniref:LysM peptidoglycan-binding domain-containing protein n=1 Tax=Paenibacillus sp. R14(2021) TaxID=2859228 RepID=UPI001C6162A0|nr:LysM peptidoglycan-binding domain-containing protein [Paenibacillus sp. R14(2021)]